MNILISTLGSRGDIQPYLALAIGLQRSGHSVTLAAPASFADWIESYGVIAHPIRFNPDEVMRSITSSKNSFQALRAMREVMNTGVMQAMEDCWQAALETDFLLQTGTGSNALEIASKRGIPVAFSHLVPMQSTRSFPTFVLPLRFSLGERYNLLTYALLHRVLWRTVSGPTLNQWRVSLGLPKWRSEKEMQDFARSLKTPTLYGYSPNVLPKPQDWGHDQHITGYWFLDPRPDWQPPAQLLKFLESGPPPVYIGFGSMRHENPKRQTALALRALELSGQRGIFLDTNQKFKPDSASPNVYYVADVPHAWLFPQMAAVVHHGGAGTTSAGLRAGIPTIITPFGGDQFAWGDQITQLRVGVQTPSFKRLTAEKLSQAINTVVHESEIGTRAAELGNKIKAEDGISKAIEIIEHHKVDLDQHI